MPLNKPEFIQELYKLLLKSSKKKRKEYCMDQASPSERYKRLLFGVNSAPEIFQKVMENLLAPCENAYNYLDDIIVYGRTEKEHDESLKVVLNIFKDFDVTLNKEKCLWKVQKLKFLGHILSTEGISPDADKIKTVQEFRPPQSKEETRSFLGLVTYLGKFVPDMADVTEPLRSDASPVALGAVLIQFENKVPRVISFASKSLSQVERRYSQTEKEGLALVWAVERFSYYLAGTEFELVTDHKPLEAIFKPTSRPPARIERWVLRLQAFRFKVVYQPGKLNIADSVSRLCKIQTAETFDEQGEQNIFAIIEKTVPRAITISEICSNNTKDQELMEAVNNVKNEKWDTKMPSSYFPFKLELCTIGNILLRGTRIVIPMALISIILELAHEGHPGETVMKRRVRSKVWWPLVDKDVEQFVKKCRDCLIVSKPSQPVPMNRHVFPDRPWSNLAMDLLGPLPNHDYILVAINYYSRYQEFKFLKRITSKDVINFLREIFCRLGYPKFITADNGRQFVSEEFKTYCKDNNIELITSPPYWPQANGEVENMNRQIVKRLKIAHSNGSDYKEEMKKFTLMYNVTPHGTTGKAPSELLYNRTLDIEKPMLDSEARDRDFINKQKGKERGDRERGAKDSGIEIGDKVLIKMFQQDVNDNPIITTTTPSAAKEQEAPTDVKGSDPRFMLKLKNIEGIWRPVPQHDQESG
ncbi:uncharacterized protein K02A2.6-like [Eupeodes corollae]|uniref:uncharacterized protein K02A2.6-like n=1 Tax=Eupeodes corollae TaxID=290404 RepID=UPI0024924993|nr:uncharacterized protein K02A2.6-like [Eupeodes corollae]